MIGDKDKVLIEECVADPALISVDHTNVLSNNDLGHFIETYSQISEDKKFDLLTNPWMPSKHYNFKNDVEDSKRPFLFKWFSQYPWLVYSELLKGALCLTCVLFRPRVIHGSCFGSFITSSFVNHKKFIEKANQHEKNKWHIESFIRSKDFKDMKKTNCGIDQVLDSCYKNKIEQNRNKLKPIISSLLFCAIHNLPIRGDTDNTAVFNDLLQFRVDAGDLTLKTHLEKSNKNALYISHRVQNELLECLSSSLRSVITNEAMQAFCFSLIVDETADINGTEQLSICVRYLDNTNLHEEFLGFFPLKEFDASSITQTILEACTNLNIDMNKCVGQGYDGCATMAGHISGVQKRINNVYPMANFFHCASHRLNLVINDLNSLAEVRNCIGKIKEVTTFVRDSALRRNIVGSHLTKLCETRFVEKHKSIRQFKDQYVTIVEGLEEISKSNNFNSKTRQRSYEMLTAITTPTFVVILSIMAKYSAKFETVSTLLQAVDVDLQEATKHIQDLLSMLEIDRNNCENRFNTIFNEVKLVASKIDFELKLPRRSIKQVHRENYPTNDVEIYFRQSLFIPYLESIIMSLKDRFSDEKLKIFTLYNLHPKKMKLMSDQKFIESIEVICTLYGSLLDNFKEQALSWYDLWKNKEVEPTMKLIDTLDYATYYPAVCQAIQIAITLPVTSCSVERSFRYGF